MDDPGAGTRIEAADDELALKPRETVVKEREVAVKEGELKLKRDDGRAGSHQAWNWQERTSEPLGSEVPEGR